MRRREFIAGFSSATAWPILARAQQQRRPILGILAAPAAEAIREPIASFREGLAQAGFADGQNVAIEYRWAGGNYDQLPGMAANLVDLPASIIVALAPAAAQAAKRATATIPVVFVIGADPVALGLVASLNKPGGNVTGVNFLINALGGKRLGLISELVPAGTIGFLINPAAPGANLDQQEAEQVAHKVGRKLSVASVSNENNLASAFSKLADERVVALVISPDALFTSNRKRLIGLAAQYALPVIYHLHEAVREGGLMSYGTSFTDAHRLAGVYAGRILKGEKAADLPVQQSTKFEFTINIKTAKQLGLAVPPSLLAIADEVIE